MSAQMRGIERGYLQLVRVPVREERGDFLPRNIIDMPLWQRECASKPHMLDRAVGIKPWLLDHRSDVCMGSLSVMFGKTTDYSRKTFCVCKLSQMIVSHGGGGIFPRQTGLSWCSLTRSLAPPQLRDAGTVLQQHSRTLHGFHNRP